MNPVRGIETDRLDVYVFASYFIFQINESRSRDWNIPSFLFTHITKVDFQINESRSRDWNYSWFFPYCLIVLSFKLMNPVRGIETVLKVFFAQFFAFFQINESRSRDWNNVAITAHWRGKASFQINESRSRDWNTWERLASLRSATTFKLMNPVRGIETIIRHKS